MSTETDRKDIDDEQMPSFGTPIEESYQSPVVEMSPSIESYSDLSQESYPNVESQESSTDVESQETTDLSQEGSTDVESQETSDLSQEGSTDVESQETSDLSQEGSTDVESQESIELPVETSNETSLGEEEESSVTPSIEKDKGVLDKASKTRTKYNRTKKRLASLDDSEKDAIRNEVITEFINVLKITKRKASRKKFARRINGLRTDFHQALNLLNGTNKKRPGRKSKKQLSPIIETSVEEPVSTTM